MKNRPTYVTEDDYRHLTTLLSEMKGTRGQEHTHAADLRHKLERAVVMPSEVISYHVITMHSEFLLQDLDTGETKEYTLVYPHEADFLEGKLSVLAPVGTALLGSQDLDVVELEAPSGRKRFRVSAIYYQPEAAKAYLVKADALIRGSRRMSRWPEPYA